MTVSVVIPTWNRGPQIGPTLDSVVNQTRAPLEILVVDDGSTDGTADWIEANYGQQVRVVRQLNGGVARARNGGWRQARGEWIAFLDHDDVFAPDKLERLAPFLEDENTGVVVSRWREIESEHVRCESPVVRPRGAFGWLFGWTNPLVSMSVPLVRRACLEQVGGFDVRCVPADDFDLWLRLAQTTRFAWCDEVLTDYILHANQQRLDERKMFRAMRRALSKHPFALAMRPLLLWWLLWSGAFAVSSAHYQAFQRGQRGAIRGALQAHPLVLLSPQWVRVLLQRGVKRLAG